MTLITDLQKMDLSEKEAKVYLAALELAEAPVQAIAKKANINRATCYFVLNTLIQKGLIDKHEKNNKTFFIAANPDSLDSIFEIKKKELEQTQKRFKNLLPDLNLIYNKAENKPVIKFYEGKEGLLDCTKDFLQLYKKNETKNDKEEPLRMMYSKDLLINLFDKDVLKELRQYRLDADIKSKVIYNYKNGVLENTTDGLRTKVDSTKFPIDIDMSIYKNSVRIASLRKKLSAIMIQDEAVAKTFKTLFDLAWKGAQSEQKDKDK